MNCPICGESPHYVKGPDDADVFEIKCPYCGEFRITLEAHSALQAGRFSGLERLHMRGAIRQLQEEFKHGRRNGTPPTIVTSRTNLNSQHSAIGLDDLLVNFPLEVNARLDKLLQNLVTISEFPGDKVELQRSDIGLAYAENARSLAFLISQLKADGLIETNQDLDQWPILAADVTLAIRVTVAGWNRFADLERGKAGSKPLQGFIAMWMHPTERDEWAWTIANLCGEGVIGIFFVLQTATSRAGRKRDSRHRRNSAGQRAA